MKNIIRKILKEERSDKYLPQDSPLIKTIINMVGNKYEGWFSDRWNEQRFDFEITFHITKINMWKVTDDDRKYKPTMAINYQPKSDSIWEGTIYVKIIKIKITDSEGRIEFLDINDIPRIQFENFEDYILDTVAKWIPGAILDVDGNF